MRDERQEAGDRNERGQTFVRMAFLFAIGLYILFSFDQNQLTDDEELVAVKLIYGVFAFGTIAIIIWNQISPKLNPTRVTAAILLDISTLTAAIYAGGSNTVVFYPLYLWIIVGAGFRFGAKYLYISQLCSLVGFGVVVSGGGYWHEEIGITVAVLVSIGPLPVYMGFLLKKLEEQIKLNVLVDRDALTGAYNRRYAGIYLSSIFTNIQNHQNMFSIVMIDIDHFKKINDQHGHMVGDAVLQEVVKRILASIRQQDVLIRYGGEEFILALEVISEKALNAAERIREMLEQTKIRTKDAELAITVSMGVAVLTSEVSSHEELIKMADSALYDAKKSGRNKVVIYNSGKHNLNKIARYRPWKIPKACGE
jgi:diguanylate cyclase (GGDEF)-like protein